MNLIPNLPVKANLRRTLTNLARATQAWAAHFYRRSEESA